MRFWSALFTFLIVLTVVLPRISVAQMRSGEVCQHVAHLEANLEGVVAATEAWSEAFFELINEPDARAAAGLPPESPNDHVGHDWIIEIAGCYANGIGTEQDVDRAMSLLAAEPAAEGSSKAQHMLASLRLFRTEDPALHRLGFDQLEAEHAGGSAYAAGKLGWAHQLGLGTYADQSKANALYEEAASSGMTYWQYLLAHAYERGYLGLTADPERSIYWRTYVPKVHFGIYECWVADYYEMGIFPANEELQSAARQRCDAADPKEFWDPALP